jgi:hypothetical protein
MSELDDVLADPNGHFRRIRVIREIEAESYRVARMLEDWGVTYADAYAGLLAAAVGAGVDRGLAARVIAESMAAGRRRKKHDEGLTSADAASQLNSGKDRG